MPYVGKEPVRGQNRELDDISGSFNGGNTAFTMQVGGINTAAGSANQVFINLGGVMQNPGTDFTVASSTITFTTPPANGLSFWGLIQGDAVDINTPADGSVTAAKLASGAGIAVLTGSTNNTVTTVTGAGAIQGEANFKYDGTDIDLESASDFNIHMLKTSVADGWVRNVGNLDLASASGGAAGQKVTLSNGANEAGLTAKLTVESGGDITVNTGNLVIGTAGKGIDFSAQTPSSATGATTGDELLDHYEEGSWTPILNKSGASGSVDSYTNQVGKYVRVGKLLWISFYLYKSSGSFGTGTGAWYVSGLPWALTHGTAGAYQFLPDGYWTVNGSGRSYAAGGQRWQSNNQNGAATLTLYADVNNDNWSSGAIEVSGTGVVEIG